MTDSMRAVLVSVLGGLDAVTVGRIPVPEPGPGEIRLTVAAAGVNFPDILMIAGQYQFKPDLPFTPGAEFAGTVSAVGQGVDGFGVGDRVVATALVGGFAEEAIADVGRCDHVPDAVDLTDAAVIPLAFGTALHALSGRAALRSGETLLVTGATGGTGSAAVKLGRILGARVIAAVGSEPKIDTARAMGADDVVVYGTETRLRDQVLAATDGRGVDVVFEAVGGEVFDECLRCIAWGGRILVVGFTSGAIPQIPANLVLLKGVSVVGVFWGRWRELDAGAASADIARIARWMAEGRLAAGVSARYPLDAAADALASIAERRVSGKVVLIP